MRLAATAILFLFAQLAHSQTLCKSSEKVFFSCAIKNKILSLCSSPNLSRDSGYVKYRFGTPNKIELSFPEKEEHPKGRFFYNGVATPGGILNHMSFRNGNYGYVVYDDTYTDNQDVNENKEIAGVVIIHNHKVVKDLSCSSMKTRTEMNLGEISYDERYNIFERFDFLIDGDAIE